MRPRHSQLAAPAQALRVEPPQQRITLEHDALGERNGRGEPFIVELIECRGTTPIEHVVPAASDGVVEKDPAKAVILGDHPPARLSEPWQVLANQSSVARTQFFTLHGEHLPTPTGHHAAARSCPDIVGSGRGHLVVIVESTSASEAGSIFADTYAASGVSFRKYHTAPAAAIAKIDRMIRPIETEPVCSLMTPKPKGATKPPRLPSEFMMATAGASTIGWRVRCGIDQNNGLALLKPMVARHSSGSANHGLTNAASMVPRAPTSSATTR